MSATGANITYGGDRAAYIPSQDRIIMPAPHQFISTEGYCSTLAHEAAHLDIASDQTESGTWEALRRQGLWAGGAYRRDERGAHLHCRQHHRGAARRDRQESQQLG